MNEDLALSERVYKLINAVERALNEKNLDLAKKTVEEAHDLALQTLQTDRAEALYHVAQLFGRIGRRAEASDLLEQAIKFVNESLDPPKVLLAICKELASIGRRERALEIARLIPNEARRAQALELIG